MENNDIPIQSCNEQIACRNIADWYAILCTRHLYTNLILKNLGQWFGTSSICIVPHYFTNKRSWPNIINLGLTTFQWIFLQVEAEGKKANLI